MVKITEEDTDRDGFMSWPGENHAAIAGATPGALLGLTWGGQSQEIAFGLCMATLGTAMGVKGVEKLTNKKLVGQMQSEAPYVLGGLLAGLTGGLGGKIAMKAFDLI